MARQLVATWGVLATPAAADPAPAGPRIAASSVQTLAWTAPASCPDAASLRARVEQRLERSLDEVTVGIDVDVTRSGGRYVARIDLGAITVANDVRTLTSTRCHELADAVAVIVARVTSEAIATRRIAAREPDEVEPIVVAAIATPPVGVAVPRRRWTLGVRLSGISGIGVIPQVGLGGEIAASLRHDSHLAELAAARWAASAAQFHNGAPAKVDVDLDVALARVGWRPPDLPLRAWLGVEVGSMRGSGIQLPSQQLESGRWLAAGAGFGIAWQMRPWIRLVGTTETMVALERVRFSLGDGIIVYAPSPMSVRTTCGIEVGWQ